MSQEERKPRLFYHCEGVDAFVPFDSVPEFHQFYADMLDGETRNIEIKRMDMTDSEFAALPEAN